MPAGLPRIEVKLLIDANGILNVSAREQRSGQQAEIQVQPSYGLTDDQVESMILDSFDAAEEDFRKRQLVEARTEADTILVALAKGKQNPAWARLSLLERTQVDKLEQALRTVAGGDDSQAIRRGLETLNQATMRLAEMMMDDAVAGALKGKTMEQADTGERLPSPHPFAKAEIQ